MMEINKHKIKRVIIISLIVIVASFASIILYNVIVSKFDSGITSNEVEQLLSRCKRKGYNRHFCIIVDYGRFVGSPRFFIYSFDKHKVIAKSIMAHGRGGHSTPWKADFSNVNGSKCSCLGYFLVKEYHVTKYRDPSFRVDGLDKGINDHARQRSMLIHPRREVDYSVKHHLPAPFGVSHGCFITDHKTFAVLKGIVKKNQPSILLWAHK